MPTPRRAGRARSGRRRPWGGLVQDLWANGLVASPLVPAVARWRLLRTGEVRLDRCRIASHVHVFGSGPLEIGAGSFINRLCVLDRSGGVSIGRRVSLGPRCLVITATHQIASTSERCGAPTTAPVRIEDGAWLGAGVTVMPGVVVGAGAVVAAGAVVLADVPPDTLVAGVPARHIRDLP